MQIDIQDTLTQIQRAKQQWQTIMPNVVTSNPAASDVLPTFDELESLLEKLPDEVDVDGVAWGMAQAQLTALVQHSGTIQNAPSVPSWLWGFKNALLDAVPLKYVAKEKGVRATKQLEAKISLLENHLDEAQQAKERIESVANQWDELEGRVETLSESFDATRTEIDALKASANEAAGEITSSASTAKEQLEEMGDILQGIEEATEKQQSLFEEFEGQRDQISAYLKNANKVGLAKSFQDKRKELTWTWRGWVLVFIIGIISMIVMGYFELLPLLKEKTLDVTAISFRFLLSSPVIWLTWFAARQYAHVLRISEDYAFKEAAALAFVGYRDEIDNDPQMVEMLQQYAIRNFGENPAKMLLKKADSSSPIHDVVDKALDAFRSSEGK